MRVRLLPAVFAVTVLAASCGEIPTVSDTAPSTTTSTTHVVHTQGQPEGDSPCAAGAPPEGLPSQQSGVTHAIIEQLFNDGWLPSGIGAAVHPDGCAFIFSKDLPASNVAAIKAAIPWVEFVEPLPPGLDGHPLRTPPQSTERADLWWNRPALL